MIILNIEVTKPKWLQPGVFKAYMKAGMFEVGRYWRRFVLKKHFTQAGAAQYAYRKRSKKYQARKLAAKGHTLPLVWSGRTRARLLGPGGVRISATSRRVTLYLSGGVGPVNYQNLYKELKTIAARERKAMAKRWVSYMAQRIGGARKVGRLLSAVT